MVEQGRAQDGRVQGMSGKDGEGHGEPGQSRAGYRKAGRNMVQPHGESGHGREARAGAKWGTAGQCATRQTREERGTMARCRAWRGSKWGDWVQ